MKFKLLLLLGSLVQYSTAIYPLFKQCDPQWASDQLGTSDETVCQAGCLMSSISMIMNSCNKLIEGDAANPQTLNRWLTYNGGYVGQNLYIWGSVQLYGLVFQGKS